MNRTFTDAIIRDIEGTGDIQPGPNRFVLIAAGGRFDGATTNYDNNGRVAVWRVASCPLVLKTIIIQA